MTTPKALTLDDIFNEDSLSKEENWDISWVNSVKMPTNLGTNQAVAIKFMTESARAIEWIGEKIAVLVFLVDLAKLEYEKEWSLAFKIRSYDKTAAGKKVEADADAVYLEKKQKHIKYKGFLEFFKQKQSGLIGSHNAAKEILRTHRNELPTSNWDTTNDAYKEENSPKTEETNSEDENFDLD